MDDPQRQLSSPALCVDHTAPREEPTAEQRGAFLDEMKLYAQYLYEEEVRRSERLHAVTKTYLIFIGSTFAGTLTLIDWLELTPSTVGAFTSTIYSMITTIILFVALIALTISLLSTIMVIKIWRIERLCHPMKLLLAFPSTHSTQHELLNTIIHNYISAATHNATANDSKGKLMSFASISYRISLIALVMSGLAIVFF